jgi:VanZ family protein
MVTLLADTDRMTSVLALIQTSFYGDKAIHFALVGVLALMVNLSLRIPRTTSRTRIILMGSAITIIVATLEECSNLWVATRSCSLGDLAANYLGILCIGIVPLVVIQARKRRGACCEVSNV